MAQRTKPVDLTRSYLPIDPNSFPETMHGTGSEDQPEKLPDVMPYEGWNFMPTGYGYRSFFGISAKLDIDALATPARTRELFVLQKDDLSNVLVALTDDGIWTKSGEAVGAWTHDVALVDPDDGTVKEWSYCVISNVLYVYRQGEASYWKYSLATAYVFTAVVPTTLNMAGQLGIFAAGSRLGFWDSANSIAYSAFDDLSYFTPDIGKGSNITSLTHLIGKIINIVQHGDGFIVYATKSIIGVRKDVNNTFLWQAVPLSKQAGISYRHQVAPANPDTLHYVWTSIGMMRIEDFKFEIIAPEFYDYLKESKDPVYLKMLEGRYLAVQLANSDYVNGQVTFYTTTIEGETIDLSSALQAYQNQSDPIVVSSISDVDANALLQAIDREMPHIYATNVGTGCANQEQSYCTGIDYPVYRDKISVPLYDLSVAPIARQIAENLFFGENGAGQIRYNNQIYSLAPSYLPMGLWEATEVQDGAAIPTSVREGLATFPAMLDFMGLRAAQTGNENIVELSSADLQIDVDNTQNFFARVAAIYNRYTNFVTDFFSKLATEAPAFNGGTNVSISSDAYELKIPVNKVDNTFVDLFYILTKHSLDAAYQGPYTQPKGKEQFLMYVFDSFELEYGVYQDQIPFVLARPKTLKAKGISHQPYYFGPAAGVGSIQARIIAATGLAVGLPAPAALDMTGLSTLRLDLISYSDIEGYLDSTVGGFDIAGVTITDTTAYDLVKYLSYSGLVDISVTDVMVNADSTLLSTKFKALTVSGTYGGNPWSFTIEFYAPTIESVDITSSTEGTVDPTLLSGTYCNLPILLSYSYIDSFFQYNLDGSTSPSATVPPAIDESVLKSQGACLLGTDARPKPHFNGMTITNPYQGNNIYGKPYNFTVLDGNFNSLPIESNLFTFPSTTFLMQTGSPTPYDITWHGAFVYDTYLKRWGKMKQDYRLLLDFSPLNSGAEQTIDFTRFGVEAAMLNSTGEVRLFDAKPTDSYLKFGKIGLFRQGTTKLEKVRADMRQPLNLTVEVETSLDGLSVETELVKTYDFTSVRQVNQGIGSVGKWHNISFKGAFDLQYLEYTSWIQGRR